MFDYSSIRLFDKKGRALPADYMKTPDTFFYIKSETGSGHDALLYPVTDMDGGAVKFAGMRVDDGGLLFADNTARRVDVRSVATNDVVCTAALKPADYMELNTADGKVYGVKSVTADAAPAMSGPGYTVPFPSVKIRSRVNFSPVSTGLFETECVYALMETAGRYTKPSDDR